MDLKNITTFIQVAELRSFTKAAEKLGYSQSTISFQIRQLENELGVPLFERINHTVSLTEHGSRFLQSAQKMNGLLESFRSETEKEHDVSGHVRLALADSLCSELIRKVFPKLHQRYPGITLECMTGGTQELFRLLNHNEADLVYTLDSHIYDTSYVILQETKIATHFVCAADNPLAQKEELTLQEIIREPFLLTEKGMSYRRLLDEQLAVQSLEIRPVFVSGNTDVIGSLVERNAGIALLPDHATKELVRKGTVKYLSVQELKADIWAQLIHHRDKWMSEPMRIVVEYLRECKL